MSLLRKVWTQTLRGAQCAARRFGSWTRADGQTCRALVVHPRLPGEKEKLVPWDASEAVALARAAGWHTVKPHGAVSVVPGRSDESEDSEEDEAEAEEEDDSDTSEDEEVEAYIARMERIDPKFYFYIKELSRVAVLVAKCQADLLFVNAALSPVQQRHLEVAMELAWRAQRRRIGKDAKEGSDANQSSVAVFDRYRTVLAIFARRASSQHGRLSIELAEAHEVKAKLGAAAVQGITTQMQRIAYDLSKKIPGCKKTGLLSRSGAARGVTTSFTSSPQITRQKQQRAIAEREKRLREEIAKIKATRSTRRQRRMRDGIQTIGLVGYTNVGKSAIVNRLSGSDLLVKDGVFVTLDIAARRFTLPSGSQCYILDSVGFIKDLPLELCEVFQATIQELHEADVILHVRDMAHPAREEQRTTVQRVLMENDMDSERVMEVWNKTDLLTEKEVRQLFYQHQLQVSTPVQAVSALTGEGFEELLEKLDQKLQDLAVRVVPGYRSRSALEVPVKGPEVVRIPQDLPQEQAAELWAFLAETGAVLDQSMDTCQDTGDILLEVKMDNSTRSKFLKKFGGAMLR